MNAFSPSANVPSYVVDGRICSVMLMDYSSGVGQLRSILCFSGSLNPCTHHLALALYPVSVSFQRKTRREDITRSRCFFSCHIRLHGAYDGHRIEIEYSLPFGFDCFRKLHPFFGRKVVPRYLVGVASTEIKFSMQRACLCRRNRKGSLFLVFPDVEASSLLPCFLDVHRSFSSDRHPSSVSVALHRHFVVSRRSCSYRVALQLDCHLHLHSPFGAQTNLLRVNKKEQQIHLCQLVLVFSHAVPPSTRGPGCVQMMSRGNLSLFSKSNPAIIDSSFHVSAG